MCHQGVLRYRTLTLHSARKHANHRLHTSRPARPGLPSIVDYDGFEDCEVPDMETWSKALNAGQYPLSVVGLSETAAELYVVGIYGNTMTTNPRALETAISVLDRITPEPVSYTHLTLPTICSV